MRRHSLGDSRAPHGARGLKYLYYFLLPLIIGRAPHGARGLKFRRQHGQKCRPRRAPHGARGLKSGSGGRLTNRSVSRPTRGAWIEIFPRSDTRSRPWSRPTRGAWIEIHGKARADLHDRSRPTRGAWIEICRNQGEHGGCNGRTPHGVRGLKFDHRAGLLFPNRRAPRRTPPTADAPDCKCSPGRSYKRKACSAERTRSEARGHRRATGEEVP